LKAAKDIDSKAVGLVRFYRDVVQQQAANLDLEGLLSLFEHDRTHFSKMVASLIPIMNMLTSGPLGPLLSPNPLDVDDRRPITTGLNRSRGRGRFDLAAVGD
jgi:conjugal transfer pilus assembly protein TraD